MNFFTQLLIVCPLLFLAGFIDSVAGGGGLISTPAYMLAGLPMHEVMGTNKVCASLGTGLAAGNYVKSGKIRWNTAIVSSIFSFVGSWAGAEIALMIEATTLKKGFTFILPFIALFVLFNKSADSGVQKLFGTKMYIAASLIGFFIGMYDGLIGPGTGTFLIFAYTMLIGYDYITASGNAKLINLASGVGAAASYLLAGKVIWALVIPASAANMLGNYLGSSYALKHGGKAVKRMLIVVLVGIFVKLVIDVL